MPPNNKNRSRSRSPGSSKEKQQPDVTPKTKKQKKKKQQNSQSLVFDDGAVQFRQRLAVSLLSNRPIMIRNIRSQDLEPGLKEHEASYLRLLDRMTNGSRIEINNTGTQLRFNPGIILCGTIEHDCPVVPMEDDKANGNEDDSDDDGEGGSSGKIKARSVGWYLEGILPLAPFGKEPLSLTLRGITDGLVCHVDPSPDYIQRSVLPMLEQFATFDSQDPLLPSTTPQIRVVKRGAYPLGGGIVEVMCPQVSKHLQSIDWMDPGKFKRIRGNAVSCKLVSSSMAARVAFSAKGLFHRLLPDVWIHTDVHSHKKGNGCGPSPSLGVVLAASSTTGVVMAAEASLLFRDKELPEDLGKRAASMLLEEIRRGGVVDTGCQSLALLFMCLTPEDVSRIRLGTLSQYTIESLRLFKKAFGVEFKITPDHDTKTVVLSCLGTGYRNMARAST